MQMPIADWLPYPPQWYINIRFGNPWLGIDFENCLVDFQTSENQNHWFIGGILTRQLFPHFFQAIFQYIFSWWHIKFITSTSPSPFWGRDLPKLPRPSRPSQGKWVEIHPKRLSNNIIQGITGMKGAFVYNQETGCVPQSELKMSVYEHGQFLR